MHLCYIHPFSLIGDSRQNRNLWTPKVSNPRSLVPCSFGGYRIPLGDQIFKPCVPASIRLCSLKTQYYYEIVTAVKEKRPYVIEGKQRRDTSKPFTQVQKDFYDVISNLANTLGESMPHEFICNPNQRSEKRGIVLIPNALFTNKKDIYGKLRDRLPDTMDYTYFTDLWRRYFWYVKVKKWNPFAKCDECVYLRFRWVRKPQTCAWMFYWLHANRSLFLYVLVM